MSIFRSRQLESCFCRRPAKHSNVRMHRPASGILKRNVRKAVQVFLTCRSCSAWHAATEDVRGPEWDDAGKAQLRRRAPTRSVPSAAIRPRRVFPEPVLATTGALACLLTSTAGNAQALVANTEEARPRSRWLVFMLCASELVSGSLGLEAMRRASKTSVAFPQVADHWVFA